MTKETVRQVAGPQHPWLFWLWVALTIVGAASLMIAAPFAFIAPGSSAWLDYIVPPLMFILLMVAVVWLVWITAPRPAPDSWREHTEER